MNNIPTWKERLFEDQPALKGQYPNNESGALHEIGLHYKDDEIEDLRVALDIAQATIDDLTSVVDRLDRQVGRLQRQADPDGHY
jgi:hypothetical protein